METDDPSGSSRWRDEDVTLVEGDESSVRPVLDSRKSAFIRVDPNTGTDRAFKIQYAVYALAIMWGFASIFHLLTFNAVLCVGIVGAYVPWMLMWISVLVTAEGVYNVKVATARIEGWTKVSVPQKVRLLKDRTVLSISHLSGIKGTIFHLNLRVVVALAEIVTLIAILLDVRFRDAPLLRFQTAEDLVPFFFMLFVSGGFLISHFELNTFDSFHFVMHHIGVVFQLAGSLALGFVTGWSRTAVALISAEFTFVALWVGAAIAVPKRSSDERKVTRASKLCIGLELAAFTCNAAAHALAVHGSGSNEGDIWASVWVRR